MAKFLRIPTVDATASIDKVAREVVQERLRAALYYWERIAKRNQPRVEDVHQLRVWSRRSLAALELFADRLSAEAVGELHEALNKARKRAGKARDVDILMGSLHKRGRTQLKNVLDDLQDQRETACHKLRRSFRKQVKSDQISELAEQACQRSALSGRHGKAISKPREKTPFGDWFIRELATAASDFHKRLRRPRISDRQIHPLRIAGKRLRYVLEIGLATMPKTLGKRLYDALEQLQEHLGAICDCQALAEQFHELTTNQKSKDGSHLASEAKRYTVAARAGYLRFTRWWKQATGRKRLMEIMDSLMALAAKQSSEAVKKNVHRRKSQEK